MGDLAHILLDPACDSTPALTPKDRGLLMAWSQLEGEALAVRVMECLEVSPVNDPVLDIGLSMARAGDLQRAGTLWRTRVVTRLKFDDMRSDSFQGHQREISRRKRSDGLQRLILEIVRHEPDISVRRLLQALRLHEGGDVVDTVNDDEGVIEWRDALHPAGETPIRALGGRLSRARKLVTPTG